MNCPNCGTPVQWGVAFCPNCGTSMGAGTSRQGSYPETPLRPGMPGTSGPSAVTYYAQPEEKGRRVVAFLIDIVPMILLALVHLLPIVGWMLYGLLHACYWLLRDITGASPGKSVMGSVVASENGSPATTSQLIVRNVPLAIPGIIGMIPLIGIVFEFGLAAVIFSVEAVALLATGRRIGDRLARTMVFRK